MCEPPRRVAVLPPALHESSGLGASRRHRGTFWSHNDSGGGPVVYAIDSAGRQIGRARVDGAHNRDWEALAVGPCPSGDCLYIADTGDNDGRRDDPAIYRVPEPGPTDTVTAPAERFPIRFPDGRPDAEAVYVLPDGAVHIVTKGRRTPITLYRYPGPLRAGETVELLRVMSLSDEPAPLPFQVTGAAATPDGGIVAIRTYTAVQLYRVGWRGRLRALVAAPGVDVQPLAEAQGEAVAFAGDGRLVFTSEGGPAGVPATLSLLECRLD